MERKIDSFFRQASKRPRPRMMMWILILHLLQRANMSLWLLILFMSLWAYCAFMAIDRLQYPGGIPWTSLPDFQVSKALQRFWKQCSTEHCRLSALKERRRSMEHRFQKLRRAFECFKSARAVQGVLPDTVPRDKSLRLRMKGNIRVWYFSATNVLTL